MSQIRAKDTSPEMQVRSFLHRNGYRYSLHNKNMIGKPDIVLSKYKTVIFVNGCFWHAHKNCNYFKLPKTRREWWLTKLNRNSENDRKAIFSLRKNGWKVIVIWECALKPAKITRTLNQLLLKLSK